MLNRTNLTLSALALSNRLNLGTRSLAANASVNRGDQTLLVRQSHHGVMHDGMMWYHVFPVSKPGLRDSIHSRLIFPSVAMPVELRDRAARFSRG